MLARAERWREEMLSLAWHAEALHRAKHLPPLSELTQRRETRQQSDEEIASRLDSFFDRLEARDG